MGEPTEHATCVLLPWNLKSVEYFHSIQDGNTTTTLMLKNFWASDLAYVECFLSKCEIPHHYRKTYSQTNNQEELFNRAPFYFTKAIIMEYRIDRLFFSLQDLHTSSW